MNRNPLPCRRLSGAFRVSEHVRHMQPHSVPIRQDHVHFQMVALLHFRQEAELPIYRMEAGPARAIGEIAFDVCKERVDRLGHRGQVAGFAVVCPWQSTQAADALMLWNRSGAGASVP